MRNMDKILAAADEILNLKGTAKDTAFLTSQLVRVTLPHSDPGDIPAWTKKSGNISLVIRSGWDSKLDRPIGYPYGTIPRLLLFWITTEALRNKSRKIKLGESLTDFMRELDLGGNGGERGDITRLRNQMERLFRSIFTFETLSESDGKTGQSWIDVQIAPGGEFWWDHKDKKPGEIFGSWIELGEKFYEAITSLPVPLDMRALKALKNSSLALDIYAWATYKVFSLGKASLPDQFISWESFSKQIGSEYSDVKNFKKKCKEAFFKVKMVFPDLNMDYAHGGFVIHAGEPSINHRPSKRIYENVENP